MNRENYTQKELKNPLIQQIKDELISKFYKQIRFRKRVGIVGKYENRLMYENFKKRDKSNLIKSINIKKGREVYMITFMPITKITKNKITAFLSRNKTPYSGNIELSDKNAPHLHLLIYPENIKTLEKIKKKFTILNDGKFHCQKHIDLEPDYNYRNAIKTDYVNKSLPFEIKELYKMREAGFNSEEFHSYFERKARFLYLGFKQTFVSSRLPNKKIVPKLELKKLETRLEKMKNMLSQDSDTLIFDLQVPNISSEEMKSVTKILSANKSKYYGDVSLKNGRPFLNMQILVHSKDIEHDFLMYPMKFYSQSLVKIKHLLGKRAEISTKTNYYLFESKYKYMDNFWNIINEIKHKKLSIIIPLEYKANRQLLDTYQKDIASLFELGFIRTFYISRNIYFPISIKANHIFKNFQGHNRLHLNKIDELSN